MLRCKNLGIARKHHRQMLLPLLPYRPQAGHMSPVFTALPASACVILFGLSGWSSCLGFSSYTRILMQHAEVSLSVACFSLSFPAVNFQTQTVVTYTQSSKVFFRIGLWRLKPKRRFRTCHAYVWCLTRIHAADAISVYRCTLAES